MVAFGVMSGVKAADSFEYGQDLSSSTSTVMSVAHVSSNQDALSAAFQKTLSEGDKLREFGPKSFDKAADLYVQSANIPDATQDMILQAASRLTELGLFVDEAAAKSKFYDLAAKQLERLVEPNSHPKPSDFSRVAKEMADLGAEHTDRAVELYIKSVSHQDASATEIIDVANTISAFGSKYHSAAAELLDLAVNPTKNPMPYTLLKAADSFRELGGAQNLQKATDLYSQIVVLMNSTPFYTRQAAEGLSKLGPEHHELASQYFLLSVQPEKNPKADDFLESGIKLKELGSNYHDKASTVFANIKHLTDATPSHLISAAKELSSLKPRESTEGYLDTTYDDLAVDMYEQAANHKDATLDDIRYAASGLSKLVSLGPSYLSRAAELWKKVAQHKDATVRDAYSASLNLGVFADKFPKDTFEYQKYMNMVDEITKKRSKK